MSYYEFKPEDARAFAQSLHIQVREKGNELHFKKCPYCGNRTTDKETFAINMKTGQFKCLRNSCGATGNMITLSQDFDFSLGIDIDEYYKPKKTFKKFNVPEKIIPKDPAVKYLQSRGISEATARRYEITVQNDPNILVFLFKDENGETPYIKYRKMNFDKSRDKNKEWCQANGKPILFGMYQCDLNNKTLIITEGQLDSLSVVEAGYTNAVSVPNGCNGFTWFPYCYNWLQNFSTIIVFGDYERGHISLLDDLKRRCRQKIKHVRYEDYKDCKDANDILRKYGVEQIKVCIDNAEAEPIPHMRDLSEVKAINPYEIPKIKTGIKKLDYLLRGGLPMGSVVLITGKTGEGKSVLASQMMIEAIEQGHKIFAYSGELPDGVFKSILTTQAGGKHCFKCKTLDGYDGYKVSEQNEVLIDNWIKGSASIFDDRIIDDEEETVELLRLIEDAVSKCEVDFVLADNLMTAIELGGTGDMNKYDLQSTFVKRLARIARTYQIVIVLVAHMRKNNSNRNGNDEVAGSSDIANLASITLMYEKDNQINPDQRLLKVWKNRLFGYTDTEGILMNYSDSSRRVYGPEDDVNREYGWYKPSFEDAIPDEIPFE